MEDQYKKLKPVNHKRTASFELVLKKVIKDGKNPLEYNFTRNDHFNYSMKKKSQEELLNNTIEVEYIESSPNEDASEKRRMRRRPPNLRQERRRRKRATTTTQSRSYSDSSEEHEEYRPEKEGRRKKKPPKSIDDSLASRRKYRASLAASGINKHRKSKDEIVRHERGKGQKKPKSILKTNRYDPHNDDYSSSDYEDEDSDDHIEEKETARSEPVRHTRSLVSSGVQQRREGRRRSRPSSPVRRNKSKSRSRSRSRGPTSRGHLPPNSSLKETQAKRKEKMAKKKRERTAAMLDAKISQMNAGLKGVRTPEDNHNMTKSERGWMLHGEGPKVATWDGLEKVYQFVESVYPEKGKGGKTNQLAQRSTTMTSSEDHTRRKKANPVQISKERRKEEVKELLSKAPSRKQTSEETKVPKLKGLHTIMSEESSEIESKRLAPVGRSGLSKTEKIKVGAPSTVSQRKRGGLSVVPFAYTTDYNGITRYPKMVETNLIIPQKSKRYRTKVSAAISAVDMIVEEYQQEYKSINKKGDLVDMPPPDCLRKVICFSNLAKNHTIEPPTGFGLVMNSTRNVPIKTTPFNPTKFFYGTLAIRIPTDERIDTREAISKFSLKFVDDDDDDEYGQTREVSLLDHTEQSPPSYLAESLIPAEANENTHADDEYGEDGPSHSLFEISETPMMDKYLEGRGTYAGLYRSCTRNDMWRKHVWVVVQCNDPDTSQDLYNHLRQVQDEGMGIKDEDRGFTFKTEAEQKKENESDKKKLSSEDDGDDNEEKENDTNSSSEGSSSSPMSERKNQESKTKVSLSSSDVEKKPKIMSNWASAVFNNSKVRDARQKMRDARLSVVQELLSAYGVHVTKDDIKKMCHPFIETVTNTFHHDTINSSYIFAGSGVTIISPDTKSVIVGENPSKGPIILHGPPKSLDTRTSVRDDTLAWDLTEARGLYRLFPCCTGRQRTCGEIREYLKGNSSASKKVPILDNVVYSGKYEKEINHYPDLYSEGDKQEKGGRMFIDPTNGHYHARLTDISYTNRTPSHVRREEKCGFNRDWKTTELEPIAVRIGVEREKVNLFSF